MQILALWDGVLFVVVLAAGLLLRATGRKAQKGRPLRRIFGRRLMAAALLFLVAVPLDLWKAGVGLLVAIAGMGAVLTWCLVTVCRTLDDTHPE